MLNKPLGMGVLKTVKLNVFNMENEDKTPILQDDLLRLPEAGLRSVGEYLKLRLIPTGVSVLDEVLEGGLEQGNFYLFLGPAKSGKSSFLRSLGLALAKKTPILYVNFEQLGRSSFSTIFQKIHGQPLRMAIQANESLALEQVVRMPNDPFYIAFWPDDLDNKSFNVSVSGLLERSIFEIKALEKGVLPIVIMENLSDIYNERLGAKDNLVNIVTQTAQDIKNFCIKHEVTVFLAHHTGKITGEKPVLDDARDSKRVVDLAHSIFCSSRHDSDDGQSSYRFSYLGGRGMGGTKYWEISYGMSGEIILIPYAPPVKKSTKQSNVQL